MGLFDKLFRKSAGPPSKDEFAQLLTAALRLAGETGKLAYDPMEFRLTGGGKQAFAFHLANAYQEYCAADQDVRDQVVRQWIRGWFSVAKKTPDDFEDIKPDLLPALRSRSYFDLTSLRAEVENGDRGSWPYQVLGEHFGVGLVYDLPESMRSVQQTSLDAWGITLYEALEIARENLKAQPANFVGPQSGTGAYLSANHDSYDASRLLLTDMIRAFKLKGEPIAMVPNRETLAVVGVEDEEGLSKMVKMATEAVKQPHPISGIALRLDGDEWVPWLPAVSHPLYKDFQRLQLQTLGQNYAEQKELLDKLHEKTGQDIFVASFSAIQIKDGTVVSWATWAAGVTHALLPKTDVLLLGRIDEKPRMVPWQKAMDVAGDLLEPLDIYPFRYCVREFPTEKQLEAMGDMLK